MAFRFLAAPSSGPIGMQNQVTIQSDIYIIILWSQHLEEYPGVNLGAYHIINAIYWFYQVALYGNLPNIILCK